VVKTGKDGSRVMTCDEVYHIPTIQVEVKDTIGAGDYFNAGFIWGLWKGFDLLQSTRVANIIASLNISLDAQRSKLANPTDVDKVLEKFD
jgi:sugar/nucleoside kinase (ribokinase family)